MAEKGFYYNIHGDSLHNQVRFLAICEIVEADGVIKDTKVFKKKCNFPCEPDIFFEIETKYKDGPRTIKNKALYVVEIETKATNQSRKLKYDQYRGSLAGLTDLIVIDLDKEFWNWAAQLLTKSDEDKKGWNPYDSIALLRGFIKERLPI